MPHVSARRCSHSPSPELCPLTAAQPCRPRRTASRNLGSGAQAPLEGLGPATHSGTGFCCHRQAPGCLVSSQTHVLASGQLQTWGRAV